MSVNNKKREVCPTCLSDNKTVNGDVWNMTHKHLDCPDDWHDSKPDQSDKEMFDAQMIEKLKGKVSDLQAMRKEARELITSYDGEVQRLKDRVKELEEGMREAMRYLEFEEPTSAYKCLDGLLKKAPTDAKCLDELLPKEKQDD